MDDEGLMMRRASRKALSKVKQTWGSPGCQDMSQMRTAAVSVKRFSSALQESESNAGEDLDSLRPHSRLNPP